MNWADLTLVMTPLVCALFAGGVALDQGMGWASCLFALGGLVLGFGCGVVARGVGLMCLVAGCKSSRTLALLGSLVTHMLVPMATMFGACAGVAWLSAWIAKHWA